MSAPHSTLNPGHYDIPDKVLLERKDIAMEDSMPISAAACGPPYVPSLIGDVDTLIAATAFERNLTIITTDSDFEHVPGLDIQIYLPC
jgi:predicted nucleic acid-binding protein